MGDWLEVSADLVNQSVSFTVWPQDKSQPSFVPCPMLGTAGNCVENSSDFHLTSFPYIQTASTVKICHGILPNGQDMSRNVKMCQDVSNEFHFDPIENCY